MGTACPCPLVFLMAQGDAALDFLFWSDGMLGFLWRRLVYTLPIMLGVALVCFALVHLAPGDPLVSILPPDASAELQAKLKELYGFNRSYPEQIGRAHV